MAVLTEMVELRTSLMRVRGSTTAEPTTAIVPAASALDAASTVAFRASDSNVDHGVATTPFTPRTNLNLTSSNTTDGASTVIDTEIVSPTAGFISTMVPIVTAANTASTETDPSALLVSSSSGNAEVEPRPSLLFPATTIGAEPVTTIPRLVDNTTTSLTRPAETMLSSSSTASSSVMTAARFDNIQGHAATIPGRETAPLIDSKRPTDRVHGQLAESSAATYTGRKPANEDLWAAALRKLSDTDRAVLANDTSDSKLEILEDMRSIVEGKRDECLSRGIKIRIRDREVKLRDVTDKIIRWLDKFKEIGDVAVNFDPIHAALPWAGIRFLLQVRYSSQVDCFKHRTHGLDRSPLGIVSRWALCL